MSTLESILRLEWERSEHSEASSYTRWKSSVFYRNDYYRLSIKRKESQTASTVQSFSTKPHDDIDGVKDILGGVKVRLDEASLTNVLNIGHCYRPAVQVVISFKKYLQARPSTVTSTPMVSSRVARAPLLRRCRRRRGTVLCWIARTVILTIPRHCELFVLGIVLRSAIAFMSEVFNVLSHRRTYCSVHRDPI